jgi:hypothetical protein
MKQGTADSIAAKQYDVLAQRRRGSLAGISPPVAKNIATCIKKVN